MTDEEKKTIEILEAVGIKCDGIKCDAIDVYKRIQNLIEDQQKELEKLKDVLYYKQTMIDELTQLEVEHKMLNGALRKENEQLKNSIAVANELEKKIKENDTNSKIEINKDMSIIDKIESEINSTGYYKLPKSIERVLDSIQYSVLLYFYDLDKLFINTENKDNKRKDFFKRLEEIEWDLGYCSKSIEKCINGLCELQLIEKKQHTAKNKNVYAINRFNLLQFIRTCNKIEKEFEKDFDTKKRKKDLKSQKEYKEKVINTYTTLINEQAEAEKIKEKNC